MRNPSIDLRCRDTYYMANIVSNLLMDRWAYMRVLHDFFENDYWHIFAEPYPKLSALHRFAEFCIQVEYSEKDEEHKQFIEDLKRPTDHIPVAMREPHRLAVEQDFERLGISYQPLSEWAESEGVAMDSLTEDNLCDYMDELRLCGFLEELGLAKADEVFFWLFMNRPILQRLHLLIAEQISDADPTELPPEVASRFERMGVLKRVPPPQWVRRAVFFRDRGMCALCGMDISGLVNISTIENYDHIVPLAQGGINDVTNIQLLCERCNKTKGHDSSTTSSRYERWYQPDTAPDEGIRL